MKKKLSCSEEEEFNKLWNKLNTDMIFLLDYQTKCTRDIILLLHRMKEVLGVCPEGDFRYLHPVGSGDSAQGTPNKSGGSDGL